MAYKNFTAGSTLPYTDVQSYLMDQAVITTTSTGRPTATHNGFTIYETNTDLFQWWDGFNWMPIRNKILAATSTASVATTTTTLVKDSGIGDLTFSVSNTGIMYRYTYSVRCASDAIQTTMDIRILDGGASSPTSGSTSVAAASTWLSTTSGPGSVELFCQGIATASTGTHTIAGFYVRTAGSGNVKVENATGQFRVLSVEALSVI